MADFVALHDKSRDAFTSATLRHGLHGLQVYPAEHLGDVQIRTTTRSYLGVILSESELVQSEHAAAPAAEFPSPEAECCRKLFGELLCQAAVIAAITGNLFRLVDEYRRTERRARALEDVLLPEIDEALRKMLAHLEDADLEEVIRARLKYHS